MGFYLTHHIITRGLIVSIENTSAYPTRRQSKTWQEGFNNYVRTLVEFIDAHHNSEDSAVFPFLSDKIPGAPFDELRANHRDMISLFGEVKKALLHGEKEEMGEAWLGDLETNLAKLDGMWHPHIDLEETQVISKIDQSVPAEEINKFMLQMRESVQPSQYPPALLMPFMIYNLPKEEREMFTHDMPDEMIHHLVPIVWKDKWESMKPFLLD